MKTISFHVNGIPKGQPRARAFSRFGKVRMYDPATAEFWKSCVAAAVKPHLPESPIALPISMTIIFWMPRPKSHFKKSGLRDNAPVEVISKPDLDNLLKAVMDALSVCGMWVDDNRVFEIKARKVYGTAPGATINLEF